MTTKECLELIMAFTMAGVLLLIFLRSFLNAKSTTTTKDGNTSKGKVGGIGARTIQFTCISLIIPCIIILALEGILKGETIATIIGGLIGYVLSGISNYDNKDKEA